MGGRAAAGMLVLARAVVGMGRLRVAHERGRSRRGRRADRRCSPPWPALLVAALCVPEAFGDRALAVRGRVRRRARAGHIVLFLIAGRDDPTLRRSVVGLAVSTAIGVGLLVRRRRSSTAPRRRRCGSRRSSSTSAGPALFGIAGLALVPAHFAERHSLVIILALGESIVALGAGADVELSATVYVAAVLGVGLAAALWWIYFDVVALVTERRLDARRAGRAQRNRLARDSYSYLHFPMVAGIVLAAFGLEETLAARRRPARTSCPRSRCSAASRSTSSRTSRCGLRNARTHQPARVSAWRSLLLALWPLATEVDALVSLDRGEHGAVADDRVGDPALRRWSVSPPPRPRVPTHRADPSANVPSSTLRIPATWEQPKAHTTSARDRWDRSKGEGHHEGTELRSAERRNRRERGRGKAEDQ